MIKHRICHKESLNSRAEGFLLSWVSSKRLRGIADAEQPECMQSQRKQLFLTAPCDHSSPHMWFNSLSKLKLESGKSPISRSKKKKKKVLPPTNQLLSLTSCTSVGWGLIGKILTVQLIYPRKSEIPKPDPQPPYGRTLTVLSDASLNPPRRRTMPMLMPDLAAMASGGNSVRGDVHVMRP